MELTAVLPQWAALVMLQWRVEPSGLVMAVASSAQEGSCPTCHTISTSVHSHYTRTVADLPVGSRSVTLSVRVRRFRCRTHLLPPNVR